MRLLSLLAGLLALAACAAPDPVDPRAVLSRAQIDASPQPLLLSRVTDSGVGGTMIVQGRRDGVVTWRTLDNVALSYRDGQLIATRGLGFDLMSADAGPTAAALRGGPRAGYTRAMSYLGPRDDTQFRAFRCEMAAAGPDPVTSFGLSFPATLWVETCVSTGLRIENRYWVAPEGGLRRSVQWIGPELGYLETEQISRGIVQ